MSSSIPVMSMQYDLDNADHIAVLERVRNAFAAALERIEGPYGRCLYKPASLLPFPKEAIRAALTALLDFAEGRRQSGLLDTSLRSLESTDTIRTCLTSLDDYLDVPAAELPMEHVENATAGEAYLARVHWRPTARDSGRPNAAIDRETEQANAPMIVGGFDVSGLNIDARTGKVSGNWIEVSQGAAKSLDHQTVAELCRCCGVELLTSGSKWSVWFCKECKSRVDGLNRNAGACVVPIGRHTLMHGVGVRGGDALRDPTLVTAFLAAAKDLVRKQNRVSEWAAEIVKRNCVSCALTVDELIPISTYLEAVTFLSRSAAFEAMCEWWGACEKLEGTRTANADGQRSADQPLVSTLPASQAQATQIADQSPQVESKAYVAIQKLIHVGEWLLMTALLTGIAREASTDASDWVAFVCVGLFLWRLSRNTFATTKTPWKTVAKVSLVVSAVTVFVGLERPSPPTRLESAVLRWCQTLSESRLERAELQKWMVLPDSSDLAVRCQSLEDQEYSNRFNGRAMFYALLICGIPVVAGALESRDRFSEFDAMLTRERNDA